MQPEPYYDERDYEDGGPNYIYRAYDEVRDPGESHGEFQLRLPPRVRVTRPISPQRFWR